MIMEFIAQNMAPIMFASLVLFLLFGYPVAFSLAACGLLFFVIGVELTPLSNGSMFLDWNLLVGMPDRLWGVLSNETLLAIPFFTFMGVILEKSGMAEDLLDTIGQLFGPVRGGLAYAVIIVGALLAATTGVVAASVIAMGLISLPIMLRYGYDRRVASGVIAASGTLAQIIPPSLVLIVLADQLGKSVGDMYKGAMLPGLILTGIYMAYVFVLSMLRPNWLPALPKEARTLGSGVISLLVTLLIGMVVTYIAFTQLYPHFGTQADILAGVAGVVTLYLIAMTDRDGWRFVLVLALGVVAAVAGVMFFNTHLVSELVKKIAPGANIAGLIFNLYAAVFVGGIVFAFLRSIVARAINMTPGPQSGFGITSRLSQQVVIVMVPPLALVFFVLGTIFLGWATPTEGGAMGAVGALVLSAVKGRLNFGVVNQAIQATTRLSSFVMFILIGARMFSLTFYGVNGHLWVEHLLTSLPGGEYGFLIAVSVLVFLLAFFLDFFELAFIIVPLLAPAADKLGIDLIWFGVILGVNMQTSFMHPPFGFSLFYLRSVAPRVPYLDRITGKRTAPVTTAQIYWGAVPFVCIQIVMIGVVILFPGLVMHYKAAPVNMDNVKIEVPGNIGGGLGGLGGLSLGAPGAAPGGGVGGLGTPNFGAPAATPAGTAQGLGGVPNFGAPAPASNPAPAAN